MNRSDVIRTIQEMIDLDGEQKRKLTQVVNNQPNHFKSTFYWVRVVRAFASDSFDETLPGERSETLRILSVPIREKNRAHVVWQLLEIFMGKEGMMTDAGVFIPSKFVELVLKRSRSEVDRGRKQLLAEILLHCSQYPPKGCTPEDYLPGLHCRDELLRCKFLHFLYNHYREAPLPLIIKEIPEMKPVPSPLFYGTLTYFLRLHPEISWVEMIEAVTYLNTAPSGSSDKKDGLMLLFQEMKQSAARHQILSLNQEISFHGNSNHETTGIRLARFKKINSKMTWR